MKSVAMCVLAFGLVLATAAPSLAHGPSYYHHGHVVYYGGYARVVVAPAPLVVAPASVVVDPAYASYPAYAPAVAPAYPAVVPAPYYYDRPGVVVGYRGHGFAVRVGL